MLWTKEVEWLTDTAIQSDIASVAKNKDIQQLCFHLIANTKLGEFQSTG